MSKTGIWIITTSGERPIRDIARDLAAVGLSKYRILKEVGSITGSASDADVAKLRKVRGVTDVSKSATVDVGPPNSKMTW